MKHKLHKIDSIFLTGLFIISILGMLADAIYWHDTSEGGFPVFSCMSVYVSYAWLIGLLIYRSLKQIQVKLEYVKISTLFFLPFLQVFIMLVILLVARFFITILKLD